MVLTFLRTATSMPPGGRYPLMTSLFAHDVCYNCSYKHLSVENFKKNERPFSVRGAASSVISLSMYMANLSLRPGNTYILGIGAGFPTNFWTLIHVCTISPTNTSGGAGDAFWHLGLCCYVWIQVTSLKTPVMTNIYGRKW